MDLELKIKNFGPIDEATIQAGRFTVFAGPNKTGKTFVSKMLYSILGAINANHAQIFFDQMAYKIQLDLQRFEQGDVIVAQRPLSAIRRGIKKIHSILREASPNYSIHHEPEKLRSAQPELIAEVEKIKAHFRFLKENVQTDIRKIDKNIIASGSEIIINFESTIDFLESNFKTLDLAIHFGRQFKFRQNVQGNFQASDFSILKGKGDLPLYFGVQGAGELRETDDSFEFTPYLKTFQKQPISEAFYFESPLYWKLKSALESIKLDSNSPFRSLNGVPDYFYDMAVALRRKRAEHPLHFFGKLHRSLHSAIGGRISLSDTGDLEFHEKDKSIPLSLTSAGIANMGMLALLIERGALDQGSFLFIDEPESNLHPAWQVEMAQFLFELARQGVHVVVSTHSMTILKWIEVHVKENPEDRELVKLNKFPPDAEWNDDMDAVMAEVKQSLTKPFSDLYIQGL